MSTLIGILLDVSGSMRENAGGRINEEGGEWARSIFKVIDDLIKHDVSLNNRIFAVGVGASSGTGIFDIMSTIEQFQSENNKTRSTLAFDDILDQIFTLLENGGARRVRKWASIDVIRNAVSYDMAALMLNKLRSNNEFLRMFVHQCLPLSCRDWVDEGTWVFGSISGFAQDKYTSTMTKLVQAKEEDVIEVMEKAKALLLKDVGVIFTVHSASNIIRGCIDDNELNEDRIQELMQTVEPFIYGRTPLFGALQEARKLFLGNEYSEHKKLLFVLSDGEPTDNGNVEVVVSELKKADVTVVSCFITRSTEIHPRRLYSEVNSGWQEGAQFLFTLSSTMPTQLLPRTIFIKRGWNIDITNNETKLFLQVNHPDNIHDACDLARNVVCCQDALSDLLVSVSLDVYINQSTAGFKAQEQEGGTCYANASAAVLHLSMKRILGREGGYPDFDMLRQEMINFHGQNGAYTLRVLQLICPKYRLRCQAVDVIGAMKAITAKRPVVARFRLTNHEWNIFEEFYRNNPTGILTKNEIDITKRSPRVSLVGHAVVLTSYSSECFRFMNSSGSTWADMGFFRVQNAQVLGFEFIDVFWTLNDLTESEKTFYQAHGAEVAGKLMRSLKGLQLAEYKCPLCHRKSLVTEYTGTLLEAVCPKCMGKFRSDEEGNILAMNIYLTTLTR